MNERSFIFPAYVPAPDRLCQWRSAFPDPRRCVGLLRQARVSPDQHARYQRRGRDQCWLIYRYFENKEAVISAMADRHKQEIGEMLERAQQASTLLESLEILFTAHCCE